MASSIEKTAIESQYFPTLSAMVPPEMLAEMLHSVKFKLTQQLAGLETALDTATIRTQHLQYMVAYCPNRLQR